ncbi:PQQ-binding-like beta-propeller repeat protein [Acidobacteriota bacterium]
MKTQMKFYRIVRFIFILGLVLPLFFAGSDPSLGIGSEPESSWPQWRGPNRDGISLEKGILRTWPTAGPEVLWKTPVGEGYSGISVAGDKLFSMWDEGESQYLVCLDANNGKELWRLRVGDNFEDNYGNGPRSTPLVDGTSVYAISAQGVLYTVKADDGKILWSKNLHQEYQSQIPGYGYSSSPHIEGNKLIVTVGGKKDYAFAALDKKSGELLWHSQTDEGSYSSSVAVTIIGKRQIVSLSAKGLYSISPENGSLYWTYDWEARCPQTGVVTNTATPVFIGPDKIFVSGGFGTITGSALIQLKEKNGEFVVQELWKNKAMRNVINSSVFYKGHIYGFDNNVLECIDIETGKEEWRSRGFQRGSLIAADGHLFVLGERGKLALVEANPVEFKEISSFQIFKGINWTIPSLAQGKLFLRNKTKMVCLDVSGS